MNTKEKIIYEALGLFSRKGFDSVYMNEIAEAVGIKTPSLYKHYKSKQAIFDACCDTFYEKIRAKSSIIGLPDNNEMQTYYSKVTLVEMINNREPLKTSVEHLERQIYLSSTVYFL